MPISPQQLRDMRADFISEDRKCVGCGYNLKGLRTGGNCPECGRPIARRRRGPAYSDNLVHAPLTWLIGFRVATVLLMLAAGSFVGVQLLGGFVRARAPELVAGAIAAASLAWWIGVLLVTRPRPVMPSTVIDPRKEWFWLRMISRCSQACWPALVGLAIGLVGVGAAGAPAAIANGLYWLVGVLALIAATGLVPLCVYLSNICFWASDSTLGLNFRACAGTVTAAAVTGLALALRIVFGGLLAGPTGVLSAAVTWPVLLGAGVFTTAACGHMLWCLWRMQVMASWAVRHHVTAKDRDARLWARARGALQAEHERRRGH